MTIHLLAGTPRTGKSTAFRAVRKIFDGDTVEADALYPHYHYWAVEREDPLLEDGSASAKAKWINAIRQRDYAIWQEMRAWIKTHQEMSLGSLMVNGNIWADYMDDLRHLNIDHEGLVICDTRPEHVDHIVTIAKAGDKLSNNWQAGWPESKLRTWAEFNLERSVLHKQLVLENEYPVFDVADLGGLQQVTDAVYAHLAERM